MKDSTCTATCKNVHGNVVTGDDIDWQGLCQEGQNQGTVCKKSLCIIVGTCTFCRIFFVMKNKLSTYIFFI